MCHLINVSVNHFQGDLAEHFRPYRLSAHPTKNPTVLQALGGTPYDVTDGHCSCSFYMRPDTVDPAEAKINEARARYEREGWSKAKIDRALESKYRAFARRDRRPALDFPGAIGDLLRAGSSVQLLCHSYTGRFDDESFDATDRIVMSFESFAAQDGSFPEDTVVTLVCA